MSIADKLTQLATAKANIKQAIIDKGVDLTGVPFTAYHNKILEIEGGGSGGDPGEPPADGDYLVRFFDYDGTILKEQWVNHGESATAPSLPDYSEATSDRPALTFQEWNNNFTNVTHDIDVGAIYCTADNRTYMYIELTPATGLTIFVNMRSGTMDWGDGTITTSSEWGSNKVSHTYQDYGKYTVIYWRSSDYANDIALNNPIIANSSNKPLSVLRKIFLAQKDHVRGGHEMDIGCFAGQMSLEIVSLSKTRVHDGLSWRFYPWDLSACCFYNTRTLKHLNIPTTYYAIGNNCFTNTYSLRNITIPDVNLQAQYFTLGDECFSYSGIEKCIINVLSDTRAGAGGGSATATACFGRCYNLRYVYINSLYSATENYKLGARMFEYCYSLEYIKLPYNIKPVDKYMFTNCYSLRNIALPSSITKLDSYCFTQCNILEYIVIPNNVTSIEDGVFYNCYALKSVIVPAGVTSISNSAFSYCTCVLKYVFNGTTPPTLASTNAFTGINNHCKIYVPDESVEAYKSATNWVTYADYIYPISEMESV